MFRTSPDEDEYVAFGFSGSDSQSQMVGGDAVIAYIEEFSAYTVDYKLTAHSPVSSDLPHSAVGSRCTRFLEVVSDKIEEEEGGAWPKSRVN